MSVRGALLLTMPQKMHRRMGVAPRAVETEKVNAH
jgi:hypothetical protein